MNISDIGIDLIKRFEGWFDQPYKCPAGLMTIGYGHKMNPRDHYEIPLTVELGTKLLLQDTAKVVTDIINDIKVPVRQGQFDALTSLVYNWGVGNFVSSKGLKFLNNADYNNAAIEFFDPVCGVVKINGVVNHGLRVRRYAEYQVWSTVRLDDIQTTNYGVQFNGR